MRDPGEQHKLLLTPGAQMEIVNDVKRLFGLVRASMSVHFETGYIQIMVLPKKESDFVLPHGPSDIRVEDTSSVASRITRGG